MDLSIIIVNYNTKDLTIQCLDSIYKSIIGIEFEIFVVDNASKDNSVEEIRSSFPEVKLISNEKNLGYSKANNLAIQKSIGKYILLLNSDTVVNKNTINESIEYIKQNSNIGALGCKVLLPDKTLDNACKRSFPTPMNALWKFLKLDIIFPKSKIFGKYNLTYLDNNQIHKVDSLVGAFMLLRKETLNQTGYLDEDFFLYGEDIDLCLRIKKAGWDIVYFPKVEIIHYKGASGIKSNNPITIKAFYNSMIIFYEKHYKNEYSKFTNFCIVASIKFLMICKLNISYIKSKY